jgi:hypothetical protein
VSALLVLWFWRFGLILRLFRFAAFTRAWWELDFGALGCGWLAVGGVGKGVVGGTGGGGDGNVSGITVGGGTSPSRMSLVRCFLFVFVLAMVNGEVPSAVTAGCVTE